LQQFLSYSIFVYILSYIYNRCDNSYRRVISAFKMLLLLLFLHLGLSRLRQGSPRRYRMLSSKSARIERTTKYHADAMHKVHSILASIIILRRDSVVCVKYYEIYIAGLARITSLMCITVVNSLILFLK
jgi:hypothetical protein